MQDGFQFVDTFDPSRIVHIHRAAIGLKAIVVVDNTACGVAIGGVRMALDVSLDECFRLARAMTWKNAAAGLPHGGAKSVIFGDPRVAVAQKEQTIRAFADSIRGGVICTATEYRGGTQQAAFSQIDERIRTNTRLVLEDSKARGCLPRSAALSLAERRIRAAMATRRWR